jgi:putative restriction endonuclease
MRLFVAVTDYDWFRLHAEKQNVEEVNFWRPSPTATFKALSIGEPLLFKLHSPRNFIAGGGFFTKFTPYGPETRNHMGLTSARGMRI